MKPEETIDFHIHWAWNHIARYYNTQAAKYGSTVAVGYALLNIEKEGTLSTQLGPKMGMEARSLTRMLKTMEANLALQKMFPQKKSLIFLKSSMASTKFFKTAI